MNNRKWRRLLLCIAIPGASVLAGPCGITTLQLRDLVSSTLIRTSVTTLASLVEAATVEQALQQDQQP
ncbi:MAG: hypothetical protein ACE5HE_06070 [Phycisphaerae bacterium]